MATIQWRPDINPLTVPQSWRVRFIPRGSAGIEEIAADIARRHPNFNKADIVTILRSEDEAIQQRLLNGEQVTKEGSWSWFPSFAGRMDSPNDPLPPLDECLHVNVRISPPFLAAIRQAAQTERLPMKEKLPLISMAEDTVLALNDVLNPQGMLRLAGGNLRFDRIRDDEGCVIEGTAGGHAAQTRFGKIEDSEIILMPELPTQPHPWNNEHIVSISTRYSGRGTLRTGIYGRMLRSPLTVSGMGSLNPPEVGILTGKEASPHVSVTGGSMTADETLRIQVILDRRADALLFSLLEMKEGGAAGAAATVTANGALTLQGFTGSAVASLNIRVNDYAALKGMIRSSYGGRLTDLLRLETA